VIGADLREARVLREETVAGVDGVGARDEGGRDDVGDVEVRARGGSRSDAERLVRGRHDERAAIRIREDGDGLDPQLVSRAVDAQGDLTAICDQDFLQQWHG
jgi:hypothetical protein